MFLESLDRSAIKTVVVYTQIKGVLRMSLQENDLTIFEAIEKESNRQHTNIGVDRIRKLRK